MQPAASLHNQNVGKKQYQHSAQDASPRTPSARKFLRGPQKPITSTTMKKWNRRQLPLPSGKGIFVGTCMRDMQHTRSTSYVATITASSVLRTEMSRSENFQTSKR